MKLDRKQFLWFITLVLGAFLSLALFYFQDSAFNNRVELERVSDSLKTVIQSRDYIIKRNTELRESIVDSIQVLSTTIKEMEVRDSIEDIEYKKIVEEFRKELKNLSGSELGELMTKKYEDYINN